MGIPSGPGAFLPGSPLHRQSWYMCSVYLLPRLSCVPPESGINGFSLWGCSHGYVPAVSLGTTGFDLSVYTRVTSRITPSADESSSPVASLTLSSFLLLPQISTCVLVSGFRTVGVGTVSVSSEFSPCRVSSGLVSTRFLCQTGSAVVPPRRP